LSEKGRAEAQEAVRVLKAEGYTFDVAYTSVLKRAIRTLWIVQDEMDLMWIPVHRSWRLNERHYGALQGLNKAETAAKFGEAQVKIWRRSYDIRPPALTPDDERYPGYDPRYQNLLPSELPLTECLKDTVERFLPYWHRTIAPAVPEGQAVGEKATRNNDARIPRLGPDVRAEIRGEQQRIQVVLAHDKVNPLLAREKQIGIPVLEILIFLFLQVGVLRGQRQLLAVLQRLTLLVEGDHLRQRMHARRRSQARQIGIEVALEFVAQHRRLGSAQIARA